MSLEGGGYDQAIGFSPFGEIAVLLISSMFSISLDFGTWNTLRCWRW